MVWLEGDGAGMSMIGGQRDVPATRAAEREREVEARSIVGPSVRPLACGVALAKQHGGGRVRLWLLGCGMAGWSVGQSRHYPRWT